MKIINSCFPKESNEIALSKITIEYIQELDCCQIANDFSEDYQILTVTTDDGGGGKFIRIKTGEAGWSISNINELIEVLEDFKKRYE